MMIRNETLLSLPRRVAHDDSLFARIRFCLFVSVQQDFRRELDGTSRTSKLCRRKPCQSLETTHSDIFVSMHLQV